jgi:hypothetical protein
MVFTIGAVSSGAVTYAHIVGSYIEYFTTSYAHWIIWYTFSSL